MVALSAAMTLIAGYLLFKDRETNGRKERMVNAIAKGEQLTQGYVGEKGQIIQPTYAYEEVRVAAPLTKMCYTTAKRSHIRDKDLKVQYGVIEYLEDENGQRTYSYGDKKKTSTIFRPAMKGYHVVQYSTTYNVGGVNAPYNSTGRKDWVLVGTPTYATKEEYIARADGLFKNATVPDDPKPPSEPKPDEPLPPEQLPPSGGIPMLPPMGGVGALTPIQVGEEGVGDVKEEVDVEEIIVQENEELVEEIQVQEVDVYANWQSPSSRGLQYRRGF